jgi:outer membrane immunogenic protein
MLLWIAAALALAAGIEPLAAADQVLPPISQPPQIYAPQAAPVVVDTWSWNGVYMGINGGYSLGRANVDIGWSDNVNALSIVPPPGSTVTSKFNVNGPIAGAQLGYMWQDQGWIGGIEADFQWSGEKGNTQFLCASGVFGGAGSCTPFLFFPPPGAGATLVTQQQLRWFGTLRGRLGLLFAPRVFGYVTAGYAYGEIETSGTLTGFAPGGVAVGSTFDSTRLTGNWIVGLGIEGRLYGPVSGRIEYLYTDLARSSLNLLNVTAGVAATYQLRMTDQILRVGISYTFGSEPVRTRY